MNRTPDLISKLEQRIVNLLRVFGLLVLSAFAVLPAPMSAAQAKRPYTVDDMLKLQFIGKAASDPTGRWLVWEQTPPYDQITDFSLGGNNFGATGYRLMVVDLHAKSPTARPLFVSSSGQSYWIDSFSPSGRFLAFYMAQDGEYSMGIYDLETGRRMDFAAAPRLGLSNRHRSVWVSDDEFIFSAHLPGDQPITAARRQTGKLLWRDWNAAWRGGLSVSEVNSHADGTGDADPLAGRLIKASVKTGEMRTLADGLYDTITLSHDGRYLAALRQFSKAQSKPSVGNLDMTLSRSQLVLFDLQEGGPGQVVAPGKDVFPLTLAWAADRDRLAFFAWDIGAGVRSGIFNALDARSGKVTLMPHIGLDLASERERGFYQKPERAVWIGDRLAVLARASADSTASASLTYRPVTSKSSGSAPAKADWFLLDEMGNHENLTFKFKQVNAIPLGADGISMEILADGNLWRVGPGSSAANLTPTNHGTLELPDDLTSSNDHLPFGRQVTLVERTMALTKSFTIDLSSGGMRELSYPTRSELLATTPAGPNFAFLKYVTPAGTSLVLDGGSGKKTIVARLNSEMSNLIQTVYSPIRYSVKTRTGTQGVAGCMILPAGYKKGVRYPVVVHVYPGLAGGCQNPENAADYAMAGQTGGLDPHLLAAHGFILFEPNTSPALTNAPPNPQGGMANAVNAGIDALVAQGYADPSRIGLFGISQGGFSSLWLATQTDRFKAVVSINGWSDMYSHVFDESFMQRYYADQIPYTGNAMRYEPASGDFATGLSVWDSPDVYVRNGALINARAITAPVLLIHSDMDMFSINQYDMMFTALYQQRKEARFLRYTGEGHGPTSPANIRHMWKSIFDWYDRNFDASKKQ
jgi:dipeptidyl aminopeptidase/acylaminoacyl peptidase